MCLCCDGGNSRSREGSRYIVLLIHSNQKRATIKTIMNIGHDLPRNVISLKISLTPINQFYLIIRFYKNRKNMQMCITSTHINLNGTYECKYINLSYYEFKSHSLTLPQHLKTISSHSYMSTGLPTLDIELTLSKCSVTPSFSLLSTFSKHSQCLAAMAVGFCQTTGEAE